MNTYPNNHLKKRLHRSNINLKIAPMKRTLGLRVSLFGSIQNRGDNKQSVKTSIEQDYKSGHLYKLNSLKGRFIIFIQDFERAKTIVITDTFGSIPLYFTKTLNYIYLSHDLKSFKHHCEIELNLLHQYSQKTQEDPFLKECFLKNIFLISGNSILTIDHNTLEYSFKIKTNLLQNKLSKASPEEHIEEYKSLLIQSLQQKRQGSAVLSLSGGLDSSILLQLSAQKSIRHLFSLCTISSIENNEINRAIELAHKSDINQDIYAFNFHKQITLEHWDESIIAIMRPDGEIETYQKYLLAKMIHQQYGRQTNLITGIGSDHFNGGHSMTDYCKGQIHGDWDTFFRSLKEELSDQDEGYIELLQLSEYQDSDQEYWNKYLNYKHRGMMFGSLQKEFATETYFNLNYICPFLDEDLVRFASSIPPDQHELLFYNKNILRKISNSILPHSFRDTQKVKPNNSLINDVIKTYRMLLLNNKKSIKKRIHNSALLNKSMNTDNVLYLIDQLNSGNSQGDLCYNILKIYNFALLGDYITCGYNGVKKLFYESSQDLNQIKSLVTFQHQELY